MARMPREWRAIMHGPQLVPGSSSKRESGFAWWNLFSAERDEMAPTPRHRWTPRNRKRMLYLISCSRPWAMMRIIAR